MRSSLLLCIIAVLLGATACNRNDDDDPCNGDSVLPPTSYKDIKVVPKDSVAGAALYGYGLRYSPDSVRISTLPPGYANTNEIAVADTTGEDGFLISSLTGTSTNPCTGERVVQTGVIATFVIYLSSSDSDTLSVQNTRELTTELYYNGRLVHTSDVMSERETIVVEK